MRPVAKQSLSWLRRRSSSLILLGVFLSVTGAFLLGLTDPNNRIATTVGGLLLGGGITVVISDLTGRRAIKEQYAKDANLRRRDTVYGPLEAELNFLRQRLEAAANGQEPYPQVVLSSDSLNDSPIFPNHDPTRVILTHWPAFRQNFRRNDFSPPTQKLLDELLETAERYTQAVSLTKSPIVEALSSSVDAASKATMETEAFRAWKTVYESQERRSAPLGQFTTTENDWFERLIQQPPAGTTFGNALVGAWMSINALPIQGLVLARSQNDLAEKLHSWFRPDPSAPRSPPRLWVEQIIASAWPHMVDHSSVIDARKLATRMANLTRQADDALSDALHEIRDRYEGGRPLV